MFDRVKKKLKKSRTINENIEPTTGSEIKPTVLKRDNKRLFFGLGFVLVFGAIGAYLLINSFAATPETNNSPSSSNEAQAKRLTQALVNTTNKLKKKPGDQTLTSQAEQLAEQRQQVFLSLMDEDADKAASVQFPTDLISSLPGPAQAAIEKRTSLQGKLSVTHGETLNENTKQLENPFFIYELSDAKGKKTKLHFKGEGLDELGGATINVSGLQAGADMAVVSLTDTKVAQAAVVAPATNKKVAVVLFNFSDNTTQPWTSDQVRTAVFGTSGSTTSLFYQQASFGKYGLTGIQSATGDVYGWYTISDTSTACNNGTWSGHAQQAATAAGVNLTGYDSVIYAFPGVTACNWSGMGQLPGNTVWINGQGTNPNVVAHELGHNFGAHHANLYSCTGADGAAVPLSSTCTSVEYGDPFDVMGRLVLANFNNFHAGQLGYLSSGNTRTVTTSGTYTVAPVEQPAAGVISLRIPRDYNASGQPISYYYLEARQPSVLDNWQPTSAFYSVFSSVLIRIAPDYPTVTQSQLINMHPAMQPVQGAGLLAGETFNDPQRNISVTVQSVTSAGATVSVTAAQIACVHANPTVSLTPVTQWTTPGGALAYTLQIVNNDGVGCQASTFNLASTLSNPGVTQSPATNQFSLAPGSSTSQTITLTSTGSITAGFYTATETVTNSASPTSAATATANYNVSSPADTTSPVATITSPANGAKVSNRSATIKASATDNVKVTAMELYIDNKLVTSVNAGSLSYTWNTRKVTAGSHTIVVRAYDAAGNIGSSQIQVTK